MIIIRTEPYACTMIHVHLIRLMIRPLCALYTYLTVYPMLQCVVTVDYCPYLVLFNFVMLCFSYQKLLIFIAHTYMHTFSTYYYMYLSDTHIRIVVDLGLAPLLPTVISLGFLLSSTMPIICSSHSIMFTLVHLLDYSTSKTCTYLFQCHTTFTVLCILYLYHYTFNVLCILPRDRHIRYIQYHLRFPSYILTLQFFSEVNLCCLQLILYYVNLTLNMSPWQLT